MTSINAQIVESGVVTNCIVVDGSAVLSNGGTSLSWAGGGGGGLLTAPSGAIFMLQAGTGIGWTLSNGVLVAPASPAPPTPTQAQLAAAVVSAAIAASAAIVGQIFTDPAHQSAFQNAASIVNGNGGEAPSAGPVVAKFASLATVYGLTPAAFATLVLALQGASLDLSAALSTIETSASSATTGAQLATALAAFETAIGNVVTEVNAASPPIPVIAPATISIKGVNA